MYYRNLEQKYFITILPNDLRANRSVIVERVDSDFLKSECFLVKVELESCNDWCCTFEVVKPPNSSKPKVIFFSSSAIVERALFIIIAGCARITDMQTSLPHSLLISLLWMMGSVRKIIKKFSDLYFSSCHRKVGDFFTKITQKGHNPKNKYLKNLKFDFSFYSADCRSFN